MSITLAIYLVALQLLGVPALPISGISGEQVLTGSPGPPTVRTKISIIWSCLVTIFSCTWVAVHPNIPGHNATQWLVFVRRVRVMAIALVAPEAVIIWAMRQWINAYKLGHKYRSYGWTQAHGYFVIMGGFAIFEGDDMHHVVVAEEIGDLLKNGEIRITEKEIRDKGRGDALSKGLILIQTTWFILQCIARKVVHLPITELELVTLAFAALNFVTYALWWYKPLNVECPVRVYRPGKKGRGEGEVSSGTGGTRDAEAGKRQEEEAGKQKEAGKSTEASESTWGLITADIKTATTAIPASVCKAMAKIWHALRNYVHELRKYVHDYRWNVVWHALVGVLVGAVVLGLAAALLPVLGLLSGLVYVIGISMRLASNDVDDAIKDGAKEVPSFHVGPKLNDHEAHAAIFAGCVIAIVFGSIHCVGWSFAFPSHVEQHLWRIASISITSAPVSLIVTIILDSMDMFCCTIMGGFISLAASFLYVISRLLLLVLPFLSLRSLPAEAYQTVQWTTFIPHV